METVSPALHECLAFEKENENEKKQWKDSRVQTEMKGEKR